MNFSDLLKSIDHQREHERLENEERNPRGLKLGGQVDAERAATVEQNSSPGDQPATLQEQGGNPTTLHETRQVSDAEREQSGVIRDADLGHHTISTTIEIVDVFVTRRALPVANKLMQLYEKAISETYTQDEAISKWSRFQQEIPIYRQRMTDELNTNLVEGKHDLTKEGVKSKTEEHIRANLEAIIFQLQDK